MSARSYTFQSIYPSFPFLLESHSPGGVFPATCFLPANRMSSYNIDSAIAVMAGRIHLQVEPHIPMENAISPTDLYYIDAPVLYFACLCPISIFHACVLVF